MLQFRMKKYPCILLCVLILHLNYSSCDEKCTNRGVLTKRNFYVGEHDLTFRIEVSKRISHQLVSHIARTLLIEAVGYQHVIFVEQETDNTIRTLQKMSTCESPRKCDEVDVTGPEIMINLELWLYPGFNLETWINTREIEDCGPLGPIGRDGWFIEKSIVDLSWKQNGTIIDHYRAFLNTEVTAIFDLSSDIYVRERANKTCNDLREPEKYGCGPDGFYRPPKCRNTNVKCATILSDYPKSTFTTLTTAIQRYGLYVNIAWLGDEFENSLIKMIGYSKPSERKSILFYHKTPMILSGVNNFTHVTFPDCEDGLEKCEFEVNQLQKVVWKEVKSNAYHAFQVIRAMSFTQEQYHSLLYAYYKGLNRGYSVQRVACDWVIDNEFIWTNWIPVDALNRTTLYIGGIFPITGVYWRQNAVVEAAKMAAKAINKNGTVLGDYHLEILESDGHCATDQVMKSFIHYVKSDTYKTTVGILGPACSDTVEPIAGVANHFNTIIISYSAEGTLFNNQEKYEKYRFFFRTIPENSLFRFVFIKLFKKLGYTRMAALTEEGQKYPEYLSYLQDLMKSHKMTFIENRKFPRERAFTNMSMYLEDLNKKGARIIIGDFYDYAARSVMCTAYKMRMTAVNGYVWFLPSWFPPEWYDTDEMNRKNNATENVPCTTEEMVKAINGHMSLSYKFYGDDDRIMQENITVRQWKEHYTENLISQKKSPSSYGGYAYDAVWVYALALNRLIKENDSNVATIHGERTSRRFVELLRETRFDGVTGPLFFQNGSRVSDVLIWQWFNRSRLLIGVYKARTPDEGELELNETKIKWLTPDGQKPEDGSKEYEDCAVPRLKRFLGNVNCETAKIVANVIGSVTFAVLVVIGIILYKRRYDKRLRNTEKRMKELGLFGLNGVPYSLDEWEMPRDNIVLNRKIGEGAFGTVYGGEALAGKKGWIAVAVKTLKRGSKIEEKLDFLGEAEIMKQFEHINIVKLVGVCTTEEPIYTVMEFMLYGDLKTYLLSRRHMASEKDRWKNEEVSDRRLTNMALDIARGLSYLAERKFVHRDLACRNCLVNTSRSVKIADFGMCRRMYDSDYYRYNKKGILPIRWMAPESLIDFIFTTMSDVWSYGVVLYEIITFASYPYQGFSQYQVLEHIKSHKTLPVPKGCKPALEALLLRCWSSKPAERPQAAAIVEILATDPELITPCLDVPAASIDLEDTIEELCVKALDGARHSFSSVWPTRKSAIPLDPNHPESFDTTQLVQAGLETVQSMKQTGCKHPFKKTLHESFKKAKRDLRKNSDDLPQTTYL